MLNWCPNECSDDFLIVVYWHLIQFRTVHVRVFTIIYKALMTRSIVRVRCVVLVPTRDLVVQVKEVFRQLIKGTGLKVR